MRLLWSSDAPEPAQGNLDRINRWIFRLTTKGSPPSRIQTTTAPGQAHSKRCRPAADRSGRRPNRAKVINSPSVRRSASIPCRAGQIRLSSMHRPPPKEGRVGRPSRSCVGRRPALNPSLYDLRFTPDRNQMEVDGIELPQRQLSWHAERHERWTYGQLT
jgi:hypothetical protein